ncbi:Serine/threonine protein kinase [Trema orientale]|uniref:Serine/threonine protein kinase n=1 Tax=Trema orientale TaxID=63057 RepID=A0A2P5G0I2_TREOI|nr:Serine/threonine protein kinase [Trema orientale]
MDFSGNNLVGILPPQLFSLAKLVEFRLAFNKLTGMIPPSIGNLSSLETFSVSFNNMDGTIPEGVGHLENLLILALNANKFYGTVPASLYNRSSIAVISIAVNELNGTIPANIGLTLPNLKFLSVDNNNFSGPIPLSLSNATKLQVVGLSGNNFVGMVPRDLGKLVHLRFFGFAANYLGSNSTNDLGFLASFKNLSRLQRLDFSSNQFGGVLPASIANLSSLLIRLSFAYNQIHGVIPQTLEKYTNLNYLSMEDNLFTGTIPSSFGKLQQIQTLYLSRNGFSGQIPSSFGNLTRLIYLNLKANYLNGSIPPSIGGCKNMQYLDVSQNSLSGAIPKEVINLLSLSLLLDLSQNSLSGTLPINLGNLKNINALDFSKNNLSGEIPTTIGDCESLEYLSLKGNSFQGFIPSTLGSLRGLTHLDLSQNNFSGTIPKGPQNLRFLLYFNASFNDLEGEMPTKGVFSNASAISVIENSKLCGGVPELQLPACPDAKKTKHGISHAIKLLLIIISVVLGLIFPGLLLLYWKRNSKGMPPTEELDPFHLSKVSYKMLYDGTGGFSPTNLIGSGSFGSVYKGILNPDERAVAIKVFNLQHLGASKSFRAECMALKNARHRNLVKIITSCSSIDYHGNDFKAMIFEFVENSSLEKWLHPEKNSENKFKKFGILHRLNIATNVASALHYLHFECEPPIVHCDLKPSNVLLDSDMVAHVGDFGLARILSTTNNISQNQSSTIGLKGSVGYAPPGYNCVFLFHCVFIILFSW